MCGCPLVSHEIFLTDHAKHKLIEESSVELLLWIAYSMVGPTQLLTQASAAPASPFALGVAGAHGRAFGDALLLRLDEVRWHCVDEVRWHFA
jgi:hypothetical protein